MDERIIRSDACVAEGAAWLCAQDAAMARAYDLVSPLPLRLRPDGFAQLFSAMVSQQVSVASANAIWGRIKEAGLDQETAARRASAEDLRALGLSRQKIRYAQALADAGVDYDTLRSQPSAEVIKTLTAITGIGVWTAEIYAKFSLGRADVFAAGDLALQEGARSLYALPERPSDRAMRQMALNWSPWRSVAARILWAYYAYDKSREGVT